MISESANVGTDTMCMGIKQQSLGILHAQSVLLTRRNVRTAKLQGENVLTVKKNIVLHLHHLSWTVA